MQDGHPLAYLSKALGPKSQGLSTYDKECMAILLLVQQCRAYLQYEEFLIRTDQRSLVHLEDQRMVTPWQQKALTKLMGLQLRIVYKKGMENRAVDALSRRNSDSEGSLSAISMCLPDWVQEIAEGYNSDPSTTRILEKMAKQGQLAQRF